MDYWVINSRLGYLDIFDIFLIGVGLSPNYFLKLFSLLLFRSFAFTLFIEIAVEFDSSFVLCGRGRLVYLVLKCLRRQGFWGYLTFLRFRELRDLLRIRFRIVLWFWGLVLIGFGGGGREGLSLGLDYFLIAS